MTSPSLVRCLALALLATTTVALRVPPALGRAPARPARALASRAAPPTMGLFAPEPLLHASLPTTTAVADIVDNVAAFADSPAILLLPIGAGAVVAGLIIFVLVKAAG